eukprot:sb/3473832/
MRFLPHRRFAIDPGLNANEPERFLKHIQSGACTIDVWDADSLFHIGSVTAKLRRLARQGEHGVQSTQVFDIHSGGDGVAQGKLHLRIANIGGHACLGELLHYVIIMRCFPATNGFKIDELASKTGFPDEFCAQKHFLLLRCWLLR